MNHSDHRSDTGASFIDFVKAWPQYLLPHYWLTLRMYRLSRSRVNWIKTTFINWFVTKYHVDLSEAKISDPMQFESFNAFFTRELNVEARPVSPTPNTIISPVDGAISQFGKIENGNIFQAKNRHFNLNDLLANEQDWIKQFYGGEFITLYLSPKDYHRIHLPLAATLKSSKYVPGRLFSVNPATTRAVPRLFARNERLICEFDSPSGSFLLIMVGALFVAGIETVWQGTLCPPHGSKMQRINYPDKEQKQFQQGDEIGRFNMGSTVILLFAENKSQWHENLNNNDFVKMGQDIAKLS